MSKRIYINNAPYLLTTNTKNRYPFFQEDIFCNILIDVIAECQKIKPFELISFKINPNHVHLILQPTGRFNISKIMHSIKRVSSDQINQIISSSNPENKYEIFEWTPRMKFYYRLFTRKNNYLNYPVYPPFKWQPSFDDQLIRTSGELKARIIYVENQSKHHDLKENKFLFFNKNIPENLVFIGNNKT